MSVQVPDLKVYKEIYKKAWSYGFNNTCDINYCSTLSFTNESVLESHVKNWLWLNELSYLRRYEEENLPELHMFLKLRSGSPVNTYQMLKYLECIKYNIEISTIETGKTGFEYEITIPTDKADSYLILCNAIDEIKSTIINQIPKYKDAKWSS